MRLGVRQAQTSVKNQYDRPTCVAFAVTALHEYACDVRTALKNVAQIDLSEEFLHYHCKRRDGLARGIGTTIAAAAASLATDGQSLESLCPYRITGSHTSTGSPSVVARTDAKARICAGLRQLGVDIATLEASLRAGTPLVAVMDWYSNSYQARNGRIGVPTTRDRLLGRHAILIVELDDESSAGEYTITFKNSWGVKWGDNGFGCFNSEYFRLCGRELWGF
jgi:C1A family cysteine protease